MIHEHGGRDTQLAALKAHPWGWLRRPYRWHRLRHGHYPIFKQKGYDVWTWSWVCVVCHPWEADGGE